MNALIECIEHFTSVKLWWDFFKNSLQVEKISFSKTKHKDLSHEHVVLTNEIIKLKALLVIFLFLLLFEILKTNLKN